MFSDLQSAENTQKDTVHIGVLVHSAQIPAWQYLAIEKIQQFQPKKNITLIYTSPAETRKQPFALWRGFVFRQYLSLERVLFSLHPNALDWRDIRQLRPEISSVVLPANGDTEDEIRLRFDALLDFTDAPTPGFLKKRAAITLRVVDPTQAPSTPIAYIGFLQTLTSAETSQVGLLVATQRAERSLLVTQISADKISYTRNRNRLLWTACQLIVRAAEQIITSGTDAFLSTAVIKDARKQDSKSMPLKSDAHSTLLAPARSLRKYFLRKVRRFILRDQWTLFYMPNCSDNANLDLKNLTPICLPRDRFWADPHVIKRNGRHYVFFEELFYKNGTGHIAYLTINADGTPSPAKTILKKPYHLSYPFVFQYNYEYYMIPESAANRTVDLYRSARFPDQWTLQKTLLNNIHAMDTTVFYWHEKWWLFTNVQNVRGAAAHAELFLFFADDLLQEKWHPHPLNPVVSDVRSARPAGRIFVKQGKIYRPAQDCAKRYGYGIRINQITRLSTTDYAETSAEFIQPDWKNNIVATHTYSATEDFVVLDAAVRRRKR